MPLIAYKEKRFSASSQQIIEQANAIIREYRGKGFMLTLRQLYYQFVSRDLIANKTTEYKRLGSIINDARLAGLIDWEAIEDRTRNLQRLSHWESPADIIKSAASSYRTDKWSTQDCRIEVWIEKEALASVFEPVCNEFDIPFLCCRGYTSQSEMWVGAMRLVNHEDDGKQTIILHFGDHDPSGIDMTRDIEDRLSMFGSQVRLKRIALNFDQVEQYKPPPNPAKETDSRFAGYIREYGGSSWELDALNPEVLAGLVSDEVLALRDNKEWDRRTEQENREIDLLKLASLNWAKVEKALIRKKS